MMKIGYNYRIKSSSNTGIIGGDFDCVATDEDTIKGKAAIEILKSLHHQGILDFALITIPDEIEEKRIDLIQENNENN